MNGVILKGYKRISKKCGADRELCRTELIEYAEKSFRMVPPDMAEEMIEFFTDDRVELDVAVEKLDDVFDLFIAGEKFEGDTVLELSDWTFLKELVNEWAVTEDLELDLIAGVMTVILDKGLM